MFDGWIKVHRKMQGWEWYRDSTTFHLFVHLLFRASYGPRKWRGIELGLGQLVTGRQQLSQETGISEQSVRTVLKRLESTGEITRKSTNRFSIITICKYSFYQGIAEADNHQVNQPPNQQLPNNQPATNHIQEIKKGRRKEKTFVETSEPFRLAHLLFCCIQENKPDFKKPNLQVWAKHIDLMLRRDGRDPKKVEQVIRWAQSNNMPDQNGFCWAVNILSTQKLRKQFDQLVMRMSKREGECVMSALPPELRGSHAQ